MLNGKISSLLLLIKKIEKERDLKVIMHFPHSSIDFPESIYIDVCKDREYINSLAIKMGDVLLLDLFKYWDYEKIIAPYSRIYVDVEKYWDDSKEEISKYGMGAVYEKDIYGEKIHKKVPFL